jgi:hypothetical protein
MKWQCDRIVLEHKRYCAAPNEADKPSSDAHPNSPIVAQDIAVFARVSFAKWRMKSVKLSKRRPRKKCAKKKSGGMKGVKKRVSCVVGYNL